MYERKSVAILWWESDLLNRAPRWTLHAKVTWSEYQQYAKTVSGEGKDWKGVLI